MEWESTHVRESMGPDLLALAVQVAAELMGSGASPAHAAKQARRCLASLLNIEDIEFEIVLRKDSSGLEYYVLAAKPTERQ